MKTAKEMFEDLGYEECENNKRYLRFRKANIGDLFIEFDLINKKIRLYTRTPQYNNNPRYADFKEFIPITKQIEELRWDEN